MKIKRNIFCLCLASALLLANILPTPKAFAYTQKDLQDINAKINNLRAEMNGYEKQANALANEAQTIQNEINSLRIQQNKLKAEIQLKEAERQKLIAEIETISKRISDNSETVGYTIAQYYYNSEVSTLERIVSSESFSSFIDEEMQLASISDTLSAIIEENKNLKAELEVKKKNAERMLEDLKGQKAQLATLESQQAVLLAQTRASEATYRQMKSQVASQKAALEEEQQKILADLARQYNATNITAGDPNKGSYPYSNRCPSAKINGRQFADQWGMYICECVSYTAWKVFSTYGYMPYWGGRGNAKQWIGNARGAGYKVSNIPKPGTVGI